MRNSKTLIQAMEEIAPEVVEEVSSEPSLDAQILEQEETGNDIDVMQDQVEDAEEIQEVLEDMDAAATPEEAVCIAKEHLLNRIGYKAKVGMESFTASDSDFKRKIEGSIQLAQEGIFSRMGNAIKATFTSKKSLLEQASSTLVKIKEKGSKDNLIEAPGWGRIFTTIGKTEIDGSDVIKIVSVYHKLFSDSDLSKMISDTSVVVKALDQKATEGKFFTEGEGAKKVVEITAAVEKIKKKFDLVLNLSTAKKTDSNFKSLTIDEAEKLSKEVIFILSDNIYSRSMDNLYSALDDCSFTMDQSGSKDTVTSQEIKEMKKSIYDLTDIIGVSYDIIRDRNKICYSIIQYIKASTK